MMSTSPLEGSQDEISLELSSLPPTSSKINSNHVDITLPFITPTPSSLLSDLPKDSSESVANASLSTKDKTTTTNTRSTLPDDTNSIPVELLELLEDDDKLAVSLGSFLESGNLALALENVNSSLLQGTFNSRQTSAKTISHKNRNSLKSPFYKKKLVRSQPFLSFIISFSSFLRT